MRYIRNSIDTQSCASVPPAPACSVSIASDLSYSPLRSADICALSACLASVSVSADSSSVRSASASLSNSSAMARRSSALANSLSKLASVLSIYFASLLTACAALGSEYSAGSFCRSSSSLRRALSLSGNTAAYASLTIASDAFILFLHSSRSINHRQRAFQSAEPVSLPQQFLYFLPLPHGHRSFLPTCLDLGVRSGSATVRSCESPWTSTSSVSCLGGSGG